MMENKKILCIGAHFDDIEIGAGGFIAREKQNGSKIKLVVVGDGEYYSLSGKNMRTRDIALKEGLSAGQELGVEQSNIICLDYREGSIPYNNEIVKRIEQIIKEFKPNFIITHWYHDTHQDHINVSSAVVSAVVSAARYHNNILMWEPIFPSGRHSPIPFVPQFFVDISNVIEQKINSLESHSSQVEKFKENGVPWVKGIIARAQYRGFECQSAYAEAFYVYRMKS
jgi:LmbE family N-acetylglucosaminyl deacetylase